MNPYAAPAADASMIEVDPREAVPPMIVKLGGGLLGTAGFFVAASGLQLFAFFYLTTGQTLVASALLLLGSASVGVAPLVIAGRAWAAIAGTLLAVASTLLAAAWLAYALWSGLFSPIMILGALTMSLAMLAQPFTILPSLRVGAARRALYS